MSSLQRKRGSEEEGICQNSINTYMDLALDASALSEGELSGGSLGDGEAEGESKQGC